MKFYLGDNIEIEIPASISNNFVFVNDYSFIHENKKYSCSSMEFKIDDIYFLLNELTTTNPGKKIFIKNFERLANNSFAMFFAIEN